MVTAGIRAIAFVLFLFAAAAVQAQGIEFFSGTWEEAKAEAKKRNKPIFMDAYTTWCGPCKKMAAQVFPKKEVGKFYNANFINYKLDMEKGEGPEVAKQFKVEFYPTYLFFDATGKLIHKSLGYQQPEEFVSEGSVALDPQNNLGGLTERFRKGARDTAFLHKVIVRSADVDKDLHREALSAYWQKVKPEQMLSNPDVMSLFIEHESDISSPQFDYALAHRKEIQAVYGKDALKQAVYDKAGTRLQEAIDAKDDKLFKRVHEVLMTSEDKGIRTYALFGELIWLVTVNDLKRFEEKAEVFVKDYATSSDQLNHLAWAVFSTTDDKRLLEKAEGWAKRAYEQEKNFFGANTYASLLYKNRKFTEAEAMAQRAIELAEREGEDPAEAQSILDNIKALR